LVPFEDLNEKIDNISGHLDVLSLQIMPLTEILDYEAIHELLDFPPEPVFLELGNEYLL
jgi:hypothetical protein